MTLMLIDLFHYTSYSNRIFIQISYSSWCYLPLWIKFWCIFSINYHVLALLVCISKLLGQKPRFYRRTETTTFTAKFRERKGGQA